MANLNYAKSYQQALTDAFPYVLNFGALYATPNNGRYRWTGAKTIEIPTITTTGRVAADRDTVAFAQRNYDNSWEEKTLTNQRKWSTLVHPMDIDQTNFTATIANITQHFNNFQKFPEMDAYTASKIYYDWTAQSFTADTTVLTTANVLTKFDDLMLAMDNKRVPVNGRILYCTHEIKTMLKQAQGLTRTWDVQSSADGINRGVHRLDEVQIIGVPAELMRTAYDFTSGWKTGAGAGQINMMLIHPVAVITPISYTFATLDAPSGMSEGKWVYYEESFEDVFILNKMADAIQFNATLLGALTVTSAAGTASGDTKLTVSPSLTSGNSYVYNVGTSAHALPAVGEKLETGSSADWTAWNGTADITAATGKKLVLVEVDANSKAVKAGSCTVTAKS